MINVSLKRGTALLLSVSVLSGLSLPAAGTIKAYADTGSEPSILAYATKEQLENSFTPNADGTATNVGKIYFGKNEGGEKQEWYVLGSDSSVNGGKDNTAILVASNIIESGIQFQSCTSEITFNKDTMGTYDSGDAPSKVYYNHYGASALRSKLQSLAADKNYFSEAEQALMNVTPVKTEDYRNQDSDNNPRYYTTSDKLYAPGVDPTLRDASHIYVGSETDKKALARTNYWSNNGNWFWLRSPRSNDYSFSLAANPRRSALIDYVDSNLNGVRPASNLNLSNVLFASAAQSSTDEKTSGEIAVGTAMTLRLDGSKLDIGKVTYSNNDITVVKATESNAALVVQGKDPASGKDWYYSRPITSKDKTKITADDVLTELKQPESGYLNITTVSLSDCRIWLEVPFDDGSTFAYAVKADKHDHYYDGTYRADENKHWKECTPSNVCPDLSGSIIDEEAHTFDENRQCIICGFGAEDGTWKYYPEEKGTCSKSGKEEHWEYSTNGCTALYKFSGEYEDKIGVQIKILKSYTGPDEIDTGLDPSNHAYDKKYIMIDESNHKEVCTGCQETLKEEAHTFNGNKCTACGYTKKSSSGGSSSGSSSSSSSSTSGSWTKDSNGWRIKNSDGTYAKGIVVIDANGNKVEKVLWQNVGGKCFAIGSDGYLRTGWICDGENGRWYYCDENTGRAGGWFLSSQDGYWYYLSPSTGEMLTGWQSINGKDYYFAKAPSAPTYSYNAESNVWIYSNIQGIRPFGSMYAGTVTPDNYTVDANGAWIH